MTHIALGRVIWKDTLVLNATRAVSASLIWCVIFSIASQQPTLIPLAFSIVYLSVYMPIGIVCTYVARFFWSAGLTAIILAVMVCIGDPLIFIFSRIKPGIIPIIDGFYPINFSLIIFVLSS